MLWTALDYQTFKRGEVLKPLFWHALQLLAVRDHQTFKRGEVLKYFLVEQRQIWEFRNLKINQICGKQPLLGKRHHIFRSTSDYQISKRGMILQTPPFWKHLNICTPYYMKSSKRWKKHVHLVR
ncbi:hypothetical protein I3842_14G099700 [Carya illinoinensis]|uniref:Uncharacterized protein n=1 Tax=Carya illinoinensis TaxID=32201 RepID=A0A922ABY8_CARIL|nr:hypothetical protein I3842_14G099700 [Carya illinoinensis]